MLIKSVDTLVYRILCLSGNGLLSVGAPNGGIPWWPTAPLGMIVFQA